MSFLAGELLTADLLNSILTKCGDSDGVVTSEGTTSTSYADLATAGPSVTLTSAGSLALVLLYCGSYCTTSAFIGQAMSFAVSGATTLAASDANGRIVTTNNAGFGFNTSAWALIPITPGSNTYTAKYKVASATSCVFHNRRIYVFAP